MSSSRRKKPGAFRTGFSTGSQVWIYQGGSARSYSPHGKTDWRQLGPTEAEFQPEPEPETLAEPPGKELVVELAQALKGFHEHSLEQLVEKAVERTVRRLFEELELEDKWQVSHHLQQEILRALPATSPAGATTVTEPPPPADEVEGRREKFAIVRPEEAGSEGAPASGSDEGKDAPEQGGSPYPELVTIRDSRLQALVKSTFAALEKDLEAHPELQEKLYELTFQVAREERDRIADAKDPEHEEQVGMLERRIRKLTKGLELVKAAIARVSELEELDEGIASIYNQVQGLAPIDALLEVKREMLKDIYQANLELQRKAS